MSALQQRQVGQMASLGVKVDLLNGLTEPTTVLAMNTSLRGRVRNTHLSKKQVLMPLFEAVINSIHAIEDSGRRNSDGAISVFVHRVPQVEIGAGIPHAIADVVGLSIEDNGIGFDADNFESFRTLDTEHKVARGGRGIGRLLWIKCFEKVSVDSVFVKEGKKVQRTFSFDAQLGIHDHNEVILTDDRAPKTMIKLDKLRGLYQRNWRKNTQTILDQMLEHFLWYFVREEGCPKIVLHDNGSTFCLHKQFSEGVQDSIVHDNISIKNQEFSVLHVKLRQGVDSGHFVTLCADGRSVEKLGIKGRIPGLFERVEDSKGPFIHGSYVTSEFLNDRVQPDRDGFDILEDRGLFLDTEISRSELMLRILGSIREQLSDIMSANTKKSSERIHRFVCKNPNYKPILKYLQEEDKVVDPSISDRDLDLYLHKKQQDMEHNLREDGEETLRVNEDEPFDDYEQRVQEYIDKISDLNKAALAKYVSHRRAVIDFLASAIGSTDGQNYSREAIVHKLIMPKGLESTEVSEANSNLWLIDERLAFHDYLASDKSLNRQPITDSDSLKRPDIDALNISDNPILISDRQIGPFPSLTIIEFKRPMQQGRGDPVEQVLGYMNAIRDGKIKTAHGRLIPNAESIMGYCYVIADLTIDVRQHCEYRDYTPMHDGNGYFGFHKNYKCYVEVISYDRLVTAASERNHAFFAKLGFPST